MTSNEIDYQQLRSLVQRLSYKPNTLLACEPARDAWDGIGVVRLMMYVPDSRRSHPTIDHWRDTFDYCDRTILRSSGFRQPPMEVAPVGLTRVVPPGLDQRRFLDWMRCFLREAENHELDEWFKIDGHIINDPHKLTAPF